MDAHAASFANIQLDTKQAKSTLFCFTKLGPQPKLNIMEVGVPQPAFMKSVDIPLSQGDFPISMVPDNKYQMLFILTKQGMLFLYEIQSGKCIFAEKASQTSVFASIESSSNESGIITIDLSGKVSKFYVDSNNIVKYLSETKNDYTLAGDIARRCNLSGGSDIFIKQFQQLMSNGNYQKAIELAATSPQGVLRNLDTMNALRPINNGQVLFQYFQILLKRGNLNAIESIELVKPILQKGAAQGLDHIKNWIQQNKLTESEELGDLLKNTNVKFALAIYHKCKIHDKVISCFLSLVLTRSY